jgi:diguanylate cyclase (GGDEF)-like protein
MTAVDELTGALLDQLPGAVAVIDVRDPALPVVFANQPLADLRSASPEAVCAAGVLGLLGDDPGRLEALRRGIGAGDTLTLRVALIDPVRGLFSAELRFEPLRTVDGTVTHYAAFHDRVGLPASRADAEPPARPPVARDDRLTGLRHVDLFHEFFRRDFSIAQREGRALGLFVFDIDALGIYNDTFGRLAGDTVIRRVGRALLSGLRRASDLVARVEGGRFIGLAAGMNAEQAQAHATALAARVRELHLHHPRSPVARVVTVTVGVAQQTPAPDDTPELLLRQALQSLDAAHAAREALAPPTPPATDPVVAD